MTIGASGRPGTVLLRTRSAAETEDLAADLASVARPGDRVALIGPLGAGKTAFTRGFARGLGVPETVTSPTFTLLHEHAGRIPLHHQDLYRLTGPEDARESGLLDERGAAAVTLVEWADRLGADAGVGAILVEIRVTGEDERELRLSAQDPVRYGAWLERARRAGAGPG